MIKIKILEATRKEIQRDFGGPVHDASKITVKLQSVDAKKGYITFRCSDKNGSRFPRTVMMAVSLLGRPSQKIRDRVSATLLKGQLRYICNCPSFLYGGFAYISTRRKSMIGSEKRKPIIRNPQEEGLTCKHIKAVADQIEKLIPMISREFETQLRKK